MDQGCSRDVQESVEREKGEMVQVYILVLSIFT